MTREISISVLLFVVCFAYNTRAQTKWAYHETSESSSIRFFYDPDLKHFVAQTSSTCFLAPLNRDEQDHVHSTRGLQDLELKMMREWVGVLPEVRIYHDDTHLPLLTKQYCARREIFLLERESGTMTSPSPVIG